MDKIVFDGIDKFGFTVVFALIVMYALYKLWNIFYKSLSDRIDKLEKNNDEYREESRQATNRLDKALDSFNATVNSFQKIEEEVKDIKDGFKNFNDGLDDIKEMMKKK